MRILATSHPGGDVLDQERVVDLVGDSFALDSGRTPYLSADVRVVYDDGNHPVHLVVYLRHRSSYTLEVSRVVLARGYQVLAIEPDYVQQEGDLAQGIEHLYKDSCPDDNVDFVFGTETTEFSSAVDGVQRAAEYAEADGYDVVVLLGSQASVTAYKNWLACDNLLVLGNIGHGAPDGIYLTGGTLSYSYFQSLAANALSPKVLYFNSCDVHNAPLEPAIIGAGASRFIGGDVPLEVGPSEATFKCFWQEAIATKGAMEPILASCEQQHYWPAGAHGISGNGPLPWGFDGASCDSGDFCDSGYCVDGVCCESACAVECSSCNLSGSEGTCLPSPDATPCPDGDLCNGDETCQSGSCSGGTPLECDTGNPCTNDSCDALTGCRADPVPDGSSCPDGDLCNGDEACLGGACQAAAEPLSCDDLNDCTEDSCDPSAGCGYQELPNNTECGGGVCGASFCTAGACVPQDTMMCDDGNPCTADSCHPELGCVYPPARQGKSCGECAICSEGECAFAGPCEIRGVSGCSVSVGVGESGGSSLALGLVLLAVVLSRCRRRRDW